MKYRIFVFALPISLEWNRFHVLIGRDVLAHCVLIYNGSTGVFTLGLLMQAVQR